jgi:hypothetical protein
MYHTCSVDRHSSYALPHCVSPTQPHARYVIMKILSVNVGRPLFQTDSVDTVIEAVCVKIILRKAYKKSDDDDF